MVVETTVHQLLKLQSWLQLPGSVTTPVCVRPLVLLRISCRPDRQTAEDRNFLSSARTIDLRHGSVKAFCFGWLGAVARIGLSTGITPTRANKTQKC